LLAAEIGYRRERAKAHGFDYLVEFDSQLQGAQDAFKAAVLSPKNFGKLLVTDERPAGVTLFEPGSISGSLFKKTGLRWNLALIGLEIGGEIVNQSDVKI